MFVPQRHFTVPGFLLVSPSSCFLHQVPSWGVALGCHPLSPAGDLGSRRAAGIRDLDPTHSSAWFSSLVTQQRFQALHGAHCPPRIWSRWPHRPNLSLMIPRDNLNQITSPPHWSLLSPVVSCLKPMLRTYGMFLLSVFKHRNKSILILIPFPQPSQGPHHNLVLYQFSSPELRLVLPI